MLSRVVLSRPVVLQLRLNSTRAEHFLTSVPLKKRGVDGLVDISTVKGKPLLIYFSAAWCGSCKMLTPKLKKFYNGLDDPNDLEIVWVSRDREADHLLQYYEKAMPAWNYIPFGDPHIAKFMERYNVRTIPSLQLVDETGNVIYERARADVEACVKENPMACFNKWKNLYNKKE